MTKDRTLTEDDLIAALPNTSGNLKLTGLDGDVEIYRDRYGIPHVRASTVHDAFFGQGSATAQDRLWHMDHDRRVAYGRWAEYAGSVAVEEDVRMRRFQLRRSVEADYVALNAETRAMLDAYAAGVNAFIETTASLPIEYRLVEGGPERWAPWDCIAVFKARHILMGVYEAKLWRAHLVNALGPERAAEVVPDEKAGGLMIVPPGALYTGAVADALDQFRGGAETIGPLHNPDDGSNNWVLSGSRTASGKPLLAGDPHRGLDTPNVYYQNHIACPEFDAIGLSFPGCPGFPHFGHNAYVAWCVTHASADYQDLYIERFKKGSSSQYESDGGWKEADVSHEVIEVRDGDPVELDVAMTHHGPIIQGSPSAGYGVAFKYTATSGTNPGLQCLPQMLRARNADETGRVDAGLGGPVQQLRLRGRPRRYCVPQSRPAPRAFSGQRVASGAGMDGRARVGWIRPVRRAGPDTQTQARGTSSRPTTGSSGRTIPTTSTCPSGVTSAPGESRPESRASIRQP